MLSTVLRSSVRRVLDDLKGRIHSRAVSFQTLEGLSVSEEWRTDLARTAQQIASDLGRPACLSVVQIGNRPDSLLYVTKKREACDQVGITNVFRHLPENASVEEAQAVVSELSAAPEVDGVLLQLPLPRQLDEMAIIHRISPDKDVDGLHPESVGKLVSGGRKALYTPCTALGCMQLLKRYGINLQGLNAVILGDSNVVGLPLAFLLNEAGAGSISLCPRSWFQPFFPSTPCSALGLPLDTSAHLGGGQGLSHDSHAQPLPSHTQAQDPRRSAAEQGLLPDSGSTGSTSRDQYKSVLDGHDAVRGASPRVVQASGRSLDGNKAVKMRRADGCEVRPAGEEGALTVQDAVRKLTEVTRCADVLFVAVGRPLLVTRDWVKPGVVVVDVGINIVDDGGTVHGNPPYQHQVVGDVAFDDVATRASAISPVPGGVGPMTISALIHNTLLGTIARHRLPTSPPKLL
eukprot:jgi/Botrbrau1/7658/Bobra.0159s0100.1